MNIRNILKGATQLFSNNTFIHRIPGSRHIYFTFDDGPDKEFTGPILDILNEFKVKATYFLVGKYIADSPELLRQIYEAGHRIALHTYNHENLTGMTFQEFKNDLEKTNNLLQDIIGKTSSLLRPPEGKTNFKNIRWAQSAGIKLIHFTHDFEDWNAKCKEDILKFYNKAQIRQGDIILYHDINQYSCEALPEILESLIKKGFTFETLL